MDGNPTPLRVKIKLFLQDHLHVIRPCLLSFGAKQKNECGRGRVSGDREMRCCSEELLRSKYKIGSFWNYVGINTINYVGAGTCADSGAMGTGLTRLAESPR